MRIIFGINNFDNAGAENFMLRLAKYFSNKGHNIGLFSLCKIESTHLNRLKLIFDNDLSDITLIEPYIPGKIESYLLWKLNGFLMRFGIKDFRINFIQKKTKNTIKRFKPDILNSHLFETDEFFSVGLEFTHVISMHGPYEYYLHKTLNDDGSLKEGSERFFINDNFIKKAKNVLSNSKNIIYCADKNLEILNHIDLPNLKIQKIYYGFERKNIIRKEIQRDTLTFGMFARGVKSKGWEQLIEAFLIVNKINTNTKLRLAYSDSAYMSILKEKYSEYNQIEFWGLIDPIESFIEQIDIVVFPTYYPGESLPNTIIESLMYDVPIISTNIAEIPNMICCQGTCAGQTVSLKTSGTPSIIELSSKMSIYLNDERLYKEHKKNCTFVAAQFTMEKCYNQYLGFFQQVQNN